MEENLKKSVITLNDVVYNYKEYDDNGVEISTPKGINSVSLSVHEGEFLALVGHNGSGKSTLAKTFNGLLLAQKGSVEVLGLNPCIEKELHQIRAKVGMVFQNPDNQTVASIVEDDVAFGPENLGVPQQELRKRVDEALKNVDMFDYAKKTPSRLSGGQKQRVAIAGALALQPKILVLDEATSMLDPVGRKEVMDTVLSLNKAGMTIVTITHFMDEAVKSDRVAVMADGELKIEGTPREVFARESEIRTFGLDVPEMAHLATILREGGLNIANDIMTVDEMVVELCRLK